MEISFNTTYKAASPKKSSIKVTAGALPSELHRMIVWIMHHQEDAKHLLPEYELLRSKCNWRDEGQKTHCGQDI